MVYITIENTKIKQYSASREPNGLKKYFSGKIEDKILSPLIGKAVYVRVRHKNEEYTFISKVKELKIRKYIVPYVNAQSLANIVGENVDADIIEIE